MRFPKIRFALLFKLAIAGAVLFSVAVVMLLPKRTGIEGWNERASPRANTVTTDGSLQARFTPGAARTDRDSYDALVRYFLEGWAAYRTPEAARAHYPGAASESGRRSDGLEGFARMFPMAGAWLAAGRPDTLDTAAGPFPLAETFARGLIAGTDPSNPAYWGEIRDYSQLLVESADVALGLWLSRESVWKRLKPEEQRRVVEWLSGALRSEAYEGNWQLFPLVVHRSLKALGADVSRFDARMQSNWEFFRTFHRGDGWFFDPPNGFDYYNAWSIHYAMFWLQRIDPGFDPVFVKQVQGDFASKYKHFFGPTGHPMMGRSVCYRMAAPVPLLTALSLAPNAVSKGEAMRALDLTWSLFLQRGAVADGSVTQGWCGADPATLARYSGPASCLWALRSLVVAYALDRELGLFDAPREPLPVERDDFKIALPVPGWTIAGTRATGVVTLTIDANPEGDGPPLRPYGVRSRAMEWLTHAPKRPDNHAALYGRRTYSSDRPLTNSCPATKGS